MYKSIDAYGNVSVLRSIRKGNKTSSVRVASLGKLEDIMRQHACSRQAALDWIDTQIRLLEAQYKEDHDTVPVTFHKDRRIEKGRQPGCCIGTLFLKRIYVSSKLPPVLDSISPKKAPDLDLAQTLFSLAAGLLLDPANLPVKISADKARVVLELLDENRNQIQKVLECPNLQEKQERYQEYASRLEKSSILADSTGYDLLVRTALYILQELDNRLACACFPKDLADTLQTLRLFQLPDGGYTPNFARTDLTDALMAACDLPLDMEYISEAKFQRLCQNSALKL